ncbi:MAG: hypothetical protein GF421_03635 [Candidatus Aminicenantes bacterium]|nr:hypothetical protein [Candidatus Aminicenantes bacterium]
MKKHSKVLIAILLVLFSVQVATATTATVQELEDMDDVVTASDAGAGDLTGQDILLIVGIIFAVIGLIVVLALI